MKLRLPYRSLLHTMFTFMSVYLRHNLIEIRNDLTILPDAILIWKLLGQDKGQHCIHKVEDLKALANNRLFSWPYSRNSIPSRRDNF